MLTRRKFLINGLRGLVLIAAAKGFYNTTSYNIELVRRDILISGLPEPFRGLKIIQLSDLHASSIVANGLFKEAAKIAMEVKPDVIFLTGDFVTGSTRFLSGWIGEFNKTHLDECIEALSGLAAPMGIYGVLGNHDFWSGKAAVESIMNAFEDALNVKWLRNESLRLEKGGSFVDLLGIDDYWEPSSSLSRACKELDEKNIKVLLSHNPDINEEIEASGLRIDLVLSGHTHGGQVVVPFIGQPVMPSKFGQKYRAGLVRDGSRQTYVSRGIGHLLFPIRINCPPEVTFLRLI